MPLFLSTQFFMSLLRTESDRGRASPIQREGKPGDGGETGGLSNALQLFLPGKGTHAHRGMRRG